MEETDGGPILRRYDTLVKMMFLGDSGVGKTSLMSSYAGQPISDSHISTIGTYNQQALYWLLEVERCLVNELKLSDGCPRSW